MRTWLTQAFGVSVPVVSAPMAGVAGADLAVAVSRAGALGMIGVGAGATPEWIAAQCDSARAAGVRFGVGLQAWVLEAQPEQLETALRGGPALISVSYGPYERHVARIHEAGLPVVTAAGTLAEALAAQAAGVDAIVARGGEGGGHGRDDVATLPLLQSVLDAVATPVVAAGGIGTARGLAAVLAAGAAGAWVGTAFLTCVEGMTTGAQRARMIAAADTDTVYGRVYDVAAHAGWPARFGERGLRTGFFDTWAGRETELASDETATQAYARALADDDVDVICVDAGQGVGLLGGETTAAEVVASLAGAGDLLRRLGEDPA
jgi:nitronate monooxygenase